MNGHLKDITDWQAGKERRGTMRRDRIRSHVRKMYAAQDGKCYYCGKEMIHGVENVGTQVNHPRLATFDHIIPASHGGKYSLSNGVCACRSCNAIRDTMDFDQFVKYYDDVIRGNAIAKYINDEKRRIKNVRNKAKTAGTIVRFAEQVGCAVQDLFEMFVDKDAWCEER